MDVIRAHEEKLLNETNKKQPVKMVDVKLTILQHRMASNFQLVSIQCHEDDKQQQRRGH